MWAKYPTTVEPFTCTPCWITLDNSCTHVRRTFARALTVFFFFDSSIVFYNLGFFLDLPHVYFFFYLASIFFFAFPSVLLNSYACFVLHV
jgi:hypothetical protein